MRTRNRLADRIGTALVAVGVLAGAAAAQPANDDCVNARVVADGFTSFDTTGATASGPGVPASCGFGVDSTMDADVWFRYTASCTGTTTVSLCGSSFDTRLAVYGGSCPGPTGLPIACNDDSCLEQSQVSFPALAGAVFLIRVGGAPGQSGPGLLQITCPPNNDDCSSAIPICVNGPMFVGTLVGATPDGSSSCGLAFGTADVWYTYTAQQDATLIVNTCGTHDLGGVDHGMDSVLSFHTGCPGTVDNEIQCSDDVAVCPDDQGVHRDAYLTTFVDAGTTIKIRVTHNGEAGPGPFQLFILPVQSNDLCSGAAPAGLGTRPYCTAGAGTDGPSDCPVNQDIWFTHFAQCDGPVRVSLCESDFDTALAVYTGDCPSLTLVAGGCNDDNGPECAGTRSSLGFTAVAGTRYLIRVGGHGAATGSGLLKITCGAPCRADWDHNGLFEPADIAAFVNTWFTSLQQGTLDGDYDGDLVVAPADVAAFVSAWFSAVSTGSC